MRVLQSTLPAVPDGAPPWVYVVAVAAGVIVSGIAAAPTIIEKLRAGRAAPTPPAPTPSPPPSPNPPSASSSSTQPIAAEAPTDTLRAMIIDLQARLTRSEAREDTLQERLLEMTGELATARGEIAALRTQIQVLTTRRHG